MLIYVRQNRGALGLVKAPLAISMIFTLFLAVAQVYKGGALGGIFYWIGERQIASNSPGIALFTFIGNEYLRPYATFSHPNTLGGFALVAFYLLWGSRKVLLQVGLVSAFALVIFSYSQNAWIALLASPVVAIVAAKGKKAFSNFVYSAVVVSFLGTLLGAGIGYEQFSGEISQRLVLGSAAGRIISSAPLLGVGLGVFTTLIPFSLPGRTVWWLQPVHNIFLLLTAEIGIIGLFLFLVLLIKGINRANTIFVIAIVLTGLLDHYWLTQTQTLLLFAIVLGLSSATIEK
jgi:O-antigen ligase